ncbi:glutathione S-transferase [Salinihabitans flavidus]|uniref:Glutathione S-transferase n=1 Tax=Salinihabitans flavidus TaxID=569882 RepID=A0A1H8SM18_9RHOB|nr:glutathione S-transferase family protein [Salinihabitans flavidus]SEO79607.1 glutathione S-transferase [Salinihabitans flavidus]
METRYRLHYAPDNASIIVRMALEALGQPYETVLVDRSTQAQRSANYLAITPTGLIPTLETPRGAIFETGAILLWLADTHGALAPAPEAPERAQFLKWLFYVSNTLHTELRMTFYPRQYVGEEHTTQSALRQQVRANLVRALDLLDELAARGPGWFNGPHPGLMDYYVGACLRWMAIYPVMNTAWFDIARTPHLHLLAQHLDKDAAAYTVAQAEGLGPTPFSAPHLPQPSEGSAT